MTMARVSTRQENKAAFATRLCSLMDERGLTAAETVRRMKEHLPEGESISHGSLSHYRRGRAIPRLRHLDALSLVLGVNKSELIAAPQPEQPTAVEPTTLQRSKGNKQEARMEPAAGDIISIVPAEVTQRIIIEDHGEEAYLKIEQRMSWDVALRILDALKRNRPE